jgi:signal transduction histidine kinase
MNFTAVSQLETRGHLAENAEAQRRRALDAEGAATSPTGAQARRRFKRLRALAHALLGFLFGYLALHPIAMAVFAWLEPGHGAGSLDFVLGRIVQSFSVGMLPMALVFALFSSVIGAVDGYYRSLLRFQRNDLAAQLAINERYRSQLEVQNSELIELSRVKRRMTYFLVHDIKNHVGCVLGYAKLLLGRNEGSVWSEKDQDAVAKISGQATRMAGAVKDMLDLAKLERHPELKIQPEPVITMLHNSQKSAALDPGHRQLCIKTDFPIVLHADCNRGMVERVLANLICNAVRHNGEDVTVTLSAKPIENGVVLSCADSGHGIQDAIRERLFDEFASSSRNDGPTQSYGLGLAFCKAAVEAHGGKIWFETESGKGTTFSFTIPNQQPAACSGKTGGDSHA